MKQKDCTKDKIPTFKSNEYLNHWSPVTALGFSGSLLYVGEGSQIKRYYWKTGKLIGTTNIFSRNLVHGIIINAQYLVAYGGRSLSILDMKSIAWDHSYVSQELQLNDWITSGTFDSTEKSKIYIQTAHNVVLIVNAESKKVSEVVECSENSILYSGTILSVPQRNLIAAGTVLGGVTIWDLATKKVLQQLSGHEGSIFGVCFSPDGKYLSSCSDDRSIRVWEVASGKEVAVGWGHYARIWQLICDYRCNERGMRIISISEDCSARVWHFNGSELRCLEVLEGHQGRNAWCGAIDVEHNVLATGGGDGRVRLRDLDLRENINKTQKVWTVDDLPETIKSETFKEYALAGDTIFASTSNGRVCYFDISKREYICLKDVLLDGYSKVRKLKGSNNFAIADRNGKVLFLKTDPITGLTKDQYLLDFKGKVADILPFTINSDDYLFTQTLNPLDKYIIISSEGKKFELTPPESFNVTSVFFDSSDGCLYIGSRQGALAVYDFFNKSCKGCWRRVMSSEDTITSISKKRQGLFFLTSRAGCYSTILIDSNFNMTVLGLNKLLKGSIEGCFLINQETLLYGFRNDLFFIWSETHESELLVEKCGGPHRAWQLSHTINELGQNIFRLVYTKMGQIHYIFANINEKFRMYLLQQGFHGREIRTISICDKTYDAFRIVATGSEDTTIRFSMINTQSQLVKSICQRHHVSGIQNAHWTDDGKYFISSAGREELVVWRITVIEGELLAHAILNLPLSSTLPDLRVMDFDTVGFGNGQYFLVTVYSDSTIKLWIVDTERRKFVLRAKSKYRECCLLNCHLALSDDQSYVLVNSTDGHIVAWNITEAVENRTFSDTASLSNISTWVLRAPIHQSSIKSSSLLKQDEKGTFLHLSAGDDNALCLSRVLLEKGRESLQVLSFVKDAHSSTITGLKVVPGNKYQVVTTSTDQKVRLWDFSMGALQLKASVYTTVADTGCIDITSILDGKENCILVGGSGVSSMALK